MVWRSCIGFEGAYFLHGAASIIGSKECFLIIRDLGSIMGFVIAIKDSFTSVFFYSESLFQFVGLGIEQSMIVHGNKQMAQTSCSLRV